jgi:hypothetical protein
MLNTKRFLFATNSWLLSGLFFIIFINSYAVSPIFYDKKQCQAVAERLQHPDTLGNGNQRVGEYVIEKCGSNTGDCVAILMGNTDYCKTPDCFTMLKLAKVSVGASDSAKFIGAVEVGALKYGRDNPKFQAAIRKMKQKLNVLPNAIAISERNPSKCTEGCS